MAAYPQRLEHERALAREIVGVCLTVFLAATWSGLSARQDTDETVRIDDDDLGGVVSDARGPEAGVWAIAETAEFGAKFVRIVATGDQGRYVMPDPPKAPLAK